MKIASDLAGGGLAFAISRQNLLLTSLELDGAFSPISPVRIFWTFRYYWPFSRQDQPSVYHAIFTPPVPATVSPFPEKSPMKLVNNAKLLVRSSLSPALTRAESRGARAPFTEK